MSALTPDRGRWVTPPPTGDGSEVWSGEEFSASVDSEYGRPASFGYADYASSVMSAPTPDHANYPSSPHAGYSQTYPYYANNGGGSAAALPPYWPLASGARRRIDGFAITAFVFGIIGAVVFAVGFGIAALRRIGRGTTRGRGLAITGLWLAAAWVVAGALFLVLRG